MVTQVSADRIVDNLCALLPELGRGQSQKQAWGKCESGRELIHQGRLSAVTIEELKTENELMRVCQGWADGQNG
jgi:hypothetical protein